MPKRQLLVAVSILSTVLFAAPALAAVTPAQKCASSKMKATGKKFAAKTKCYSKALASSVAVDAVCLQAAEDKFDDAFGKAELKGGCLHTSDAPTIEAKVDSTLSDIVGDIGCGNGQVEGDEQCDDGNLVDGDGCTSACVSALCGDGVVGVMESCDDGDNIDGDGCNASCATESGFNCTGAPSVCSPTCGDGLIVGEETCDDTNVDAGDGCSATCTLEPGFQCTGQPSVCVPGCGTIATECTIGSECCSLVCMFGFCQ